MIKKLRTKLKLNQADFGQRYNVKQPIVAKWESSDYDILPRRKTALLMVADAKKLRIKGASLEAIYG